MDKQVVQVDTPKQMIGEATYIMVIAFITLISTSDDSDQPQIGTRKANEMASWPGNYNRVAKSAKHQAPGAADHEVNTIRKCEMDIRADTYCYDKNWRLLSTIGQLFDVKGYHDSFKAITNVQVGISATEVLNDDGTIYIFIRNETLFFWKVNGPLTHQSKLD